MNNKDTELVTTEGLFYKIKKFFKELFKKEKKEEVVTNKQEENTFKEEIAIKQDEEKEHLLKLQERLRKHELTPNDVTEEEIRKLSALYDEQIAETQEKIRQTMLKLEQYKSQIEEKKKKA